MFNTAWTDLVLKVGGQILLAVLIVLAVTFGADPLFPKKNMASMIASRTEQSASATAQTNATEQKKNEAVEQKTNSAKKNEAEQKTNSVEQKNAVAQKMNTSSQTNEPKPVESGKTPKSGKHTNISMAATTATKNKK